ncbi:MAG: hypothetical protein QXN89_04120 [Candidatus Woesearchaeota archaeon]
MPKFMPTEDFIIELFDKIDNETKEAPKHNQSKLYPSEISTILASFCYERNKRKEILPTDVDCDVFSMITGIFNF